MIDQISRVYGSNSLLPPGKTSKSTTKQAPDLPSAKGASGLIPDLEDKVEISKEGLAAAKTLSTDGKISSEISQDITDSVNESWYSVGYKAVINDLGEA